MRKHETWRTSMNWESFEMKALHVNRIAALNTLKELLG